MTTATVFNAYDVTQTAGPTNAWVDDGTGKVAFPGGIGGTTFTYSFTPIDGYIVDGLARVRMEVISGDWFKFSVNGAALIQFYSGPQTHDFVVTDLTEISYRVSNYGDDVRLTLLNSSYGYPDLIPIFTPIWTSYRNTMEF